MGFTERQIFLIAAIVIAIADIVGFNELYFGYLSSGLDVISLFAWFYVFMIFYGILFLATGNTVGRTVVNLIAHVYQGFAIITLIVIVYLFFVEGGDYFILGGVVALVAFTGPMGILATALYLALNEGAHKRGLQLPMSYMSHVDFKNSVYTVLVSTT